MPRGRIPYAGPPVSSRGYDETLLQMMQNQLIRDRDFGLEERRLRRDRSSVLADLPARIYESYMGVKDRQQAEADRLRRIEIEDEQASDRTHQRLLDEQALVSRRSQEQELALQGAPREFIEEVLGSRYSVEPKDLSEALREGRPPEGSVEAEDATPRWTADQQALLGARRADYTGLPLEAQKSPELPLEFALPGQDTAEPRTFRRESPGVSRETGKPLDPIDVPITDREQNIQRRNIEDAYKERIAQASAVDEARLRYMLDAALQSQAQDAAAERDAASAEATAERDAASAEAAMARTRVMYPQGRWGRAGATGGSPTDALANDIGLQVAAHIRHGLPIESWASIKGSLSRSPRDVAILQNAIRQRVGAEADSEIEDLIGIDVRTAGPFTEAMYVEAYPERQAKVDEIRNRFQKELDAYFLDPETPQVFEDAFSQLDKKDPKIKDLRVDLVKSLLDQQTSLDDVQSLIRSLNAYNAAFPESAVHPPASFFEGLSEKLLH